MKKDIRSKHRSHSFKTKKNQEYPQYLESFFITSTFLTGKVQILMLWIALCNSNILTHKRQLKVKKTQKTLKKEGIM